MGNDYDAFENMGIFAANTESPLNSWKSLLQHSYSMEIIHVHIKKNSYHQ